MTKFPLSWPDNYPRTKSAKTSRFGNKTFAVARDHLFKELKMLLSWDENKTVVLSTNIELRLDGLPYSGQAQPKDCGVAVYFMYKKEQIVLCCDAWNKIEHNLWSIAETIGSIRSIERWGVSDFLKRSFSGFNALPPKQETKKMNWRDVLCNPTSLEMASIIYRKLAKNRHPDSPGGSTSAFQELQGAYEEAKAYFN